MSESSGPVLSVRGDARQTVPADSVLLRASITVIRRSKVEALDGAAVALAALTTDLAALGAVPLTVVTVRRPLTWSAQSATTQTEHNHDKQGNYGPTGRIIATVGLVFEVRDFSLMDRLGAAFATHETLQVHDATWEVDADNPAWPQVRAAAIHAAIAKGRDYAAALGGSLDRLDHLADVGLLGGGSEGGAHGLSRNMSMRASAASFSGAQPDTPSLDPVPQEPIAAVEARFVATGLVLTPPAQA